MERMYLEHIGIEKINPNPLNPRKDHSVKSEEMQKIIKEKGWETGITCYKKDDAYIILSGHRRWFAATQLQERTIPVFVVPKPESKLEELERLGSVQSGKTDWTPYEWAQYTFDLWTYRGKCHVEELAIKMGVSLSTVRDRLKVIRYFPSNEIEEGLQTGKLTITKLARLITWINKLKDKHPEIVEEYSENFVRIQMMKRMANNLIVNDDLQRDKFIDLADKKDIIFFLRDNTMSLRNAMKLIDDEYSEMELHNKKNSDQVIAIIEKRIREVSHIDANNNDDARNLFYLLNDLSKDVKAKKLMIEKYLND
ncbi:hypothetical protein CEW92_14625 [Bacillaceae bacterium SAS-127]|nr:hypothetical protein CEW92_14625 [Bacillaceae bacterium SAS-127]